MRWGAKVFLIVGGESLALAQGGPPFLTDDPTTEPAGRWEINVAFTAEDRPDGTLVQTPGLELEFGLLERVEVSYQTSYDVAGADGETDGTVGNQQLGVKWRFVDQRSASLDVSVAPQVDFNPTSSNEFGLLDRDTELLLPVESALSLGPVDLVVEVGYDVVFDGRDGLIYGTVVGHSFGRVALGVEVHGEADVDFATDELAVNAGAVGQVTGRANLLFSVGRSPRLHANEPDLLTYLGLQVRL